MNVEFIFILLALGLVNALGLHGVLFYALFGGIGAVVGYGVKKLLSHRKLKEKKPDEEKQSFWEL